MKYRHILVAIELSEDSNILIDRAVSIAKTVGAEVSFIHIDGTHGEIYSELIDMQAEPNRKPLKSHSNELIASFQQNTDFPVKHFLVGTGDLADKLHDTIAEFEFDLLICGHHHDFWSRIVSYSKHLINKSPIDMLVVPLK
jgi:nucleotide-binding universal stress UspA family protein